MQEAMLDKAIYNLGSVKHMAKKLGIHREHIYAWIKGVSKIPLEYALQIEYLTGGEINWKDLVPFHIVQRLKHLTLQLPKFDLPPCELVYVAIERIKSEKYVLSLTEQDKSIPLHKQRPICVDEENTLIFGEKNFYLYKCHAKKTIPAWRVSLADLANGHYTSELFVKNFLISERVAVGIALEKFLGNRQGYRSDLVKLKNPSLQTGKNVATKKVTKAQLMNKDAQVSSVKRSSMRQLIADRLGFGSHFTYQNARKITLYASAELIKQVDQRKISISKAAKRCSAVSDATSEHV
jgi:DNA-binding transcriptional regulator YdaS (Cro superfamily)